MEGVRTIHNSSSESTKLWLEPWAAEFLLAPGDSLTIVGRSEQAGRFEIVEYEDGTAAYGWAGACVRVLRGNDLLDEFPVWSDDWLPSGGSIRAFIENMFGGPGGPRE